MFGVFRNGFKVPSLPPNGIESLAIREKLNHPQFISSNRHLSQGCVDIEQLSWDGKSKLNGRSRVIVNNTYTMTFYIPKEYEFLSAQIGEEKNVSIQQKDSLLQISLIPDQSKSISWSLKFKKRN